MLNGFVHPRPSWHLAVAPIVLVLVGLGVAGDSFHVYLAITAVTAYVLTASFNLIYGYAGVFSLAHIAVYGVGAYATALLQMRAGIPFLLAVAAAMGLCAALSVLVWLPTRHLHDLFLSIATLGLAVTVQELMLKWTGLTGGAEGLLGIPFARVAGVDVAANTMAYYWLAAGGALIAWELSARITSSGMGRKFVAHRDAPVALSAVGVAPSRVRLVAFVVSGSLAGLAGAIFAHESLFIASESFGMHRLILLILAVLIGGAGSLYGPLVGVLVLVLIDELGAASAGYNTAIFGAAIVVLLSYWQGGTARIVRLLVPRSSARGSGSPSGVEPTLLIADRDDAPRVLKVEEIGVEFGGVRALESVSLTLVPGQVLGLIGPNGAGKTTLVNCVTGHVAPTTGRVVVGDNPLDGIQRPDQVVSLGVARTFQTPRLLADVSARGNVALGFANRRMATDLGEVVDSPAAREDSRRALADADGLLAAVGVTDDLSAPVSAQPYSTQKLVEVARALATGPSFLLLDEPGAGLNEQELVALAEVIARLRSAGLGVLLIDHNVSFVAGVSDALHVLDGGRTLAAGPADEVLDRPDVVAAYFGGDRA